MNNWTVSQRNAIDSKGSTLISASAGTGKTAVLTEKVVNSIIKESINIEDMIIMTFSNAAASQMKDRIKDRIREIINEPTTDRKVKNRLWSQLRRFDEAHIQTIHAFCNDIIKKYFYIANLDPNVRIADNYDVAILKNKSINEVMLLEYELMDENFISLAELIDDTETIEQAFINSYNKIVSFIDYKNWLKEAIEKYNITGNNIPDFLKEMILSDFDKAINNYQSAINSLQSENNPKLDKVIETFIIDFNILNNVREQIENDKITNITNSLGEFGATVRFPAGSNYDEEKNLRNDARDLITSKYKKVDFDFTEQVRRIKAMYPILQKFYQIFVRFDDLYNQKKKEKKIIDFNDMEKYAYIILQNDNVSSECKNSFKRVFIDEYQDTNPIQEAIIDKISKSDNLFCVGDLKQSIYRFRSSDPTLFLQRSKRYSTNMSLGSIICLNNNFRSSQNVLDCSNDIFNYITSSSTEIDYTKDDMLVHSRDDDNTITPVEVQLISESYRDMNGLSMDEIEIYNIVKTIKENLGKPIFDISINEYRPAEYGDMVILCRKLTGLTDSFTKIFSSNNIPFIIERAGELFETTEAQIIMNIIELINNPKDDLKLISLMHLGLFDFNDDDIIFIKNNMDKSYYDYMSRLDNETDISLKCKKMFSFFDDCREKQKYLSLTTIIDYIITELNIYDIFSIMNNGKQKVANIKELQKHAYDYEQKNGEKLFGFAQYIRNIQECGENVAEAILNYEENSVKITTIHKSKGLEYPLVILAFCGKLFNKMDKRSNIIVDKDAGIGVRYYSHAKKEKGKCVLRTYIENCVDDKNIEEEMRLLYVSMTRAKEKLYIQGTKADSKDYDKLDDAGSFLDWIMTTLVHSNQFCSDYNKSALVNLVGSWEIKNVEFDSLENYINSEKEEVPIETINNRFNVYLNVKEQKEISFNENIPLVMSASSGLKKKEITENMLLVPNFLKTGNDPLYIGTITHEFLKNVDFKKCGSVNGILSEEERLVEEGTMSQEDLANVDTEKLFTFFQSELGKFIISCDEYTKEKYINIIKDAKEIGYMDSNDILVRCIIDLVCKKDGKYYLIDYKTDKLNNPDDKEEVRQKALNHKKQIDLYKNALKNIYGINIEKSYIAFVNYSVSSEI